MPYFNVIISQITVTTVQIRKYTALKHMANTIFQVFYHVLSYVVNSALQYLKHVQVLFMYIIMYFIKQSY